MLVLFIKKILHNICCNLKLFLMKCYIYTPFTLRKKPNPKWFSSGSSEETPVLTKSTPMRSNWRL